MSLRGVYHPVAICVEPTRYALQLCLKTKTKKLKTKKIKKHNKITKKIEKTVKF